MKSRVLRCASLALLCSIGTNACTNEKSSMVDRWPRDSSGALASGTTVVIATVRPDGQVVGATIEKSSGNRALDEFAFARLKKLHLPLQANHGEDRKILSPYDWTQIAGLPAGQAAKMQELAVEQLSATQTGP